MGGIAIFFGIAVALLLFLGDSALMEVKNVLAMGLLLTLVGIKDDLIGVAPSWRLMVQAVIATVLFFSGVYLDSFYGIFGLYEIPIVFGWLLNMLIITTVINAYNLIDGINGLSGGLGVIASSAFGMLFLSAGGNWLGHDRFRHVCLFACLPTVQFWKRGDLHGRHGNDDSRLHDRCILYPVHQHRILRSRHELCHNVGVLDYNCSSFGPCSGLFYPNYAREVSVFT